MAYRYSIHVEAPVEKVFDFFRDPGNWHSTEPEGIEFKDVRLTREGIGTHYSWSAKFAGFSLEGFDVFTEFIPNQRITDRSSSSLEGTWTYLFEPDGSGTMLTVENRVRSFWRIPPLERLLEWAAAKTHEPRFARLKEALGGSTPAKTAPVTEPAPRVMTEPLRMLSSSHVSGLESYEGRRGT